MANPMTITTGNIIIGPCSSFSVDGQEVGATTGGVQFSMKETYTSLSIDQVAADVADAIKDQQYSIKTTLAETTLENLALAWDTFAAPVVGTSPASKTLNLGIKTGLKKEHTVTFVGPAPDGYSTRTYTCTKAVTVVSAVDESSKDKAKEYVVEFKIHPDFTQAGAEFGTIVDEPTAS